MDGSCGIKSIDIIGDTGKVTGNCKGKSFVLDLKSRNKTTDEGIIVDNKEYEVKVRSDGDFEIDLSGLVDVDRKGRYLLNDKSELINTDTGVTVIKSGFVYDNSIADKDKNWFKELYENLIKFKDGKIGNKLNKVGNSSFESLGYYDEALEAYEDVADNYPNEPSDLVEGQEKDGEKALARAIELAGFFGRDFDQIRLMNKYLEIYPDSKNVNRYLNDLSILERVDTSNSWEAIEFDDKSRVIRLVPGSLFKPTKKPSASLLIGNSRKTIDEGDNEEMVGYGNITVERVEADDVKVRVWCEGSKSGKTFVLDVNRDGLEVCQGLFVKAESTNLEQVAKIRILPFSEHTQTQSSFSVNIGIEKRAIELSPDKALKKINELNKSIEKWEEISDGLGKVVTGMKGACFATSALLTFKNFASGLSGEALARQEVMNGENGYTQICKGKVPGEYPTLNACYLGEAANINSAVSKVTSALGNVNGKIQNIQNGEVTSNSVLGKSVNSKNVMEKMAQQIRNDYDGEIVTKWVDSEGNEFEKVSVDEILSDENINDGVFTQDSLRSLWLNLELKKEGGLGGDLDKNIDDKLKSAADLINSNMIINQVQKNSQSFSDLGLGAPIVVKTDNQQDRAAEVVKLNSNSRSLLGGKFSEDVTHTSTLSLVGATVGKEGNEKVFGSGTYFVGSVRDGDGGNRYLPKEVVRKKSDGTYEALSKEDASLLLSSYGVGALIDQNTISYINEIAQNDRVVKYYVTEPYAGMPAIVPFDVKAGWYAGTRQTLPVFGGLGAFDASGRVTSFWVCNVGENKRIEFDTGYGDDLCQQVNLNTGAPLLFPRMSASESKALINKAVGAINEAANKYGNQFVTINGQQMKTDLTTGVPSTQCQDFMSPNDCHILFNVCDPVICPSSRCDFGGKYRVANVAQTGIVGSALLCLPNIQEEIIVPVCLTGIHAGIEGWTSIMRNYRDCLQENVETGQLVGICDQIYSVYMCEFFWNQFAPFVNVLLPKLVEVAYGQGTRGGAEYLTVMSAWNNMQDSVNFFTQSYAVNSLRAFRARSVSEAGGEVCKAFISAKAPDTFETLLEPDSPPQFHAWFDEKTFTTATVPATSQYKVFYHIFAGKDQGVQFSVYLRDPPQSGFYSTAPTILVPGASNFIPRGEYASDTRDFTAPEGYKELCVRINNEEHCGFKQVSSSFAVNHLRDIFVADQIQNTNIQSEIECVSGASNPGALLNPNIQAGVEEFVSPNVYNRGVVRICGTNNPASATDPRRFIDVGHCGDEKIRCWLDQRSVENAITDGNFGLKNESLKVLEQKMFENFEREGQLLSSDQAQAEIFTLQEALISLKGLKEGDKEEEAKPILDRIEVVRNMIYTFAESARLLLIEGQVNEEVARFLLGKEHQKIRDGRLEGTGEISDEEDSGGSGVEGESEDGGDSGQGVESKEGLIYSRSENGELLLNGKSITSGNGPYSAEYKLYEGIDGTGTGWELKDKDGKLVAKAFTLLEDNNPDKNKILKISEEKLPVEIEYLIGKKIFDVIDFNGDEESEEVGVESDSSGFEEEEPIYNYDVDEICVLSNVEWMDENKDILSGSPVVEGGDVVLMTVRGTKVCEDYSFIYEVWRSDWPNDAFYASFVTNTGEDISDSGESVLFYRGWRTEQDCAWYGCEEYKFKVVASKGSESVETGLSNVVLDVSEGSGYGGGSQCAPNNLGGCGEDDCEGVGGGHWYDEDCVETLYYRIEDVAGKDYIYLGEEYTYLTIDNNGQFKWIYNPSNPVLVAYLIGGVEKVIKVFPFSQNGIDENSRVAEHLGELDGRKYSDLEKGDEITG
jgi:tetratricopeptide (TPR) repeat protein